MSVETVERRDPVAPVGLEPFVDLPQRRGIEAIHPQLSVHAGDDHAGVAQYAEVLGDGWLAQPNLRDELAHGGLTVAQHTHDRAAVWLGEDGKGGGHTAYISTMVYTCQVI